MTVDGVGFALLAFVDGTPIGNTALISAQAAAGPSDEGVTFTVEPVSAPLLTDAGGREWQIPDTWQGDLCQALVQLLQRNMPPQGVTVWAVLSEDGLMLPGRAVAFGVYRHPNGMTVRRNYRYTTGWVGNSTGGHADNAIEAAVGAIDRTNAQYGLSLTVQALTGSGQPSFRWLASPAEASVNAGPNPTGRFRYLALVVTADSAIPATEEVAAVVKPLHTPYAALVNYESMPLPAPLLRRPGSGVSNYRVAVFGDSNAVGSTLDPDRSGVPVPSGWSLFDNGSGPLPVWPSGAPLQCGGLPYLQEALTAAGVTGGTIVRQAKNGLPMTTDSFELELNDFRETVEAQAGGPLDMIVWWAIANDAQDGAEAALYMPRWRHFMACVTRWWPDCIHLWMEEKSHGSTLMPELPGLVASIQAEIPVSHPGRAAFVVDAGWPPPPGDNGAHLSSGVGGGLDQAMQAAVAAAVAI